MQEGQIGVIWFSLSNNEYEGSQICQGVVSCHVLIGNLINTGLTSTRQKSPEILFISRPSTPLKAGAHSMMTMGLNI